MNDTQSIVKRFAEDPYNYSNNQALSHLLRATEIGYMERATLQFKSGASVSRENLEDMYKLLLNCDKIPGRAETVDALAIYKAALATYGLKY